MATIQIKNIGPITDTGIIPLTSVMLVIGKQSSGKSTFLKILCFCRWMEKLIMVSDEEAISQYTHNLKFLKSMKQFHRFNDSYFSSASSIRYEGDTITITMENILSDVKILRKPEFETVRYNKNAIKRCGKIKKRGAACTRLRADKAISETHNLIWIMPA